MEFLSFALKFFGVVFIILIIIGLTVGTNKKDIEDYKKKIIDEYKESEDFKKLVEKKEVIPNKISNLEDVKFLSDSAYTQDEIISFKKNKIDSIYLKPKKDADDTNMFYNKKVVITGNFEFFKDRNELAKILYDSGADIDMVVSQKTNYLISGKDSGWKKLEKAKEFGIMIFNEDEILKILGIKK